MTKKSKDQPDPVDLIESSDPLEFPAGLPGFEEHRQFILESQPDLRPFLWLRSINDSDVVFPVVSCSLLKQQVAQQLKDSHLSLVGEESLDDVALYYILRVDPKKSIITVNTRAPVIISVKSLCGYQVILDRDDLRVDEPLANLMPSPVEK
ncbi:flagellar assembly protein FliW [Candidatus Neomarinimicrobiota bacterium]